LCAHVAPAGLPQAGFIPLSFFIRASELQQDLEVAPARQKCSATLHATVVLTPLVA
jgi:hypothetical protein